MINYSYILILFFLTGSICAQNLTEALEDAYTEYTRDKRLEFTVNQVVQFEKYPKEVYSFKYLIKNKNLRIDADILEYRRNSKYSLLINHLTRTIVLKKVEESSEKGKLYEDISFLKDLNNPDLDLNDFELVKSAQYLTYTFRKPNLMGLNQLKVILHRDNKLLYSIETKSMDASKSYFPSYIKAQFSNYNLDTNLKDETVFELDDLLLIENDTYTLKKYKSYNFINAINEQPN